MNFKKINSLVIAALLSMQVSPTNAGFLAVLPGLAAIKNAVLAMGIGVGSAFIVPFLLSPRIAHYANETTAFLGPNKDQVNDVKVLYNVMLADWKSLSEYMGKDKHNRSIDTKMEAYRIVALSTFITTTIIAYHMLKLFDKVIEEKEHGMKKDDESDESTERKQEDNENNEKSPEPQIQ
jgi:hypothetical protein